jgi:hypothetical protein
LVVRDLECAREKERERERERTLRCLLLTQEGPGSCGSGEMLGHHRWEGELETMRGDKNSKKLG